MPESHPSIIQKINTKKSNTSAENSNGNASFFEDSSIGGGDGNQEDASMFLNAKEIAMDVCNNVIMDTTVPQQQFLKQQNQQF
jgi:hypothetical protein